MTSTLYQSAALDRITAPWAGKIAAFFAAVVETILMIAGNFCGTLQDLDAGCRNTGWWLLTPRSRVSRPMMSKLRLSAAFGERAPRPCAQALARIRAKVIERV